MSDDFNYKEIDRFSVGHEGVHKDLKFTSRPFHVVFTAKDGSLRSVLGDLFPDGQIDWVHIEDLNNKEDCLVTCWDYERKKWCSFYKSKVMAFVELQ